MLQSQGGASLFCFDSFSTAWREKAMSMDNFENSQLLCEATHGYKSVNKNKNGSRWQCHGLPLQKRGNTPNITTHLTVGQRIIQSTSLQLYRKQAMAPSVLGLLKLASVAGKKRDRMLKRKSTFNLVVSGHQMLEMDQMSCKIILKSSWTIATCPNDTSAWLGHSQNLR